MLSKKFNEIENKCIYKKGNEMSNFSPDTIQKKFYILLWRFHRRKIIYLNRISIQRRAINTKLLCFLHRPDAYFSIRLRRSGRVSRYLIITRGWRFLSKRRRSGFYLGGPRGGVSAGHPAGKPIISPSVCAGVSPTTSPCLSRKCSL